MKYGAVTFKGVWPRVRAKKRLRKIARAQERRVAKYQCRVDN